MYYTLYGPAPHRYSRPGIQEWDNEQDAITRATDAMLDLGPAAWGKVCKDHTVDGITYLVDVAIWHNGKRETP